LAQGAQAGSFFFVCFSGILQHCRSRPTQSSKNLMTDRQRSRSPFLACVRRFHNGLAGGIASARDSLGSAVGHATTQLANVTGQLRQPLFSNGAVGQSIAPSEDHLQQSSRRDRSRESRARAAEQHASAAPAGVASGRAAEQQPSPSEGAEDQPLGMLSSPARAGSSASASIAAEAEVASSRAEGALICVSDEESACQADCAGSSERAHLSVAEEHAECSICFEPMHSQPIVVLANEDGKRVCRHFYHATCARSMASAAGGANCPLCRTPYSALLLVPDVEENPRAWFQVVDLDGNGSLDYDEVGDILRATLPIDCHKLEKMLPALCKKWSKGGRIGYEEMMGPGGLFFYVRDAFRSAGRARDAPDIRADPHAWFRYWDEDGSDSLNQEEVVRAIVKTFGLSSDFQQIKTVREMLSALWPEFDSDGSGCIDKTEFCRPGHGLAQMIVANLASPAEEE